MHAKVRARRNCHGANLGYARRDTRQHFEIRIETFIPRLAGPSEAVSVRVRGKPNIDGTEVDARESWRRDPNDSERPPLDIDSPTDDVIAAAVGTQPERVAQDGDR